MDLSESEEPAADPHTQRLLAFKRAYKASAILLAVILGLSTPGNFVEFGLAHGAAYTGVMAIFIAATLLPFFRYGGIMGNWKWATVNATLFAILFSIMVVGAFIEFVQTGGGEGPHGEGSPLANIIAMVFGALVFLCPWLLTALRGIRCWKWTVIAPSRGSGQQVNRSGEPSSIQQRHSHHAN